MLTQTLITYTSLFLRKFDKTALRIFLETSPQYPNLVSVIHTLHYMGISASAGQCDWSYLRNLKSPFLLHMKMRGKDALIIAKYDEDSEGVKVYSPKTKKWETKTEKDILNVWDGIVIFTEAIPLKNKVTNSPIGAAIAGVGIGVLIAVVLILSKVSITDIMPLIIGLIVSGISYLRNYIAPISAIEKLCHISEATDCRKVEESAYSSIFGVKLSALAFAFFLSQLVCVGVSGFIQIPHMVYNLYFISTVMVVPAGIYSAYSQIKVTKACPLCIVIVLCMATEAILFLLSDSMPIQAGALLLWACTALIITGYLHLIRIVSASRRDELASRLQANRLKRKKSVMHSESIGVNKPLSPLWLGNEKAPVEITTIISPGCNHCRKVVGKFLALVEKGYSFRWNIILGRRSKEDEDLIGNWIQRYLSDKDSFKEYLSSWSVGKNPKSSGVRIKESEEDRVSEINRIFNQGISEMKITGFPRIIRNDRLLSPIYTKDDLEFLIMD